MSEAESKFLKTLAGRVPSAPGYRAPESRSRTDELLRAHVASELTRLQGRIDELKAAASGEGEDDMVEDLDRIGARMVWAVEALRDAQHGGLAFFTQPQVPEAQLARVCAYDQELLDDLALLATDVMNLKYETIGNLTLREAEGTMAAIEMKIANRTCVFEADTEG